MSGNADLEKAIVTAWNASSLNTLFKQFWDSSRDSTQFRVLCGERASPKQPWPYCVMDYPEGATFIVARMRGAGNSKMQEIRDVRFRFSIHAKQTTYDGTLWPAKKLANHLANELMKVYGGHPTDSPATLTLDNGEVLTVMYDNDYGFVEGNNEYERIIEYVYRLDVPVAI